VTLSDDRVAGDVFTDSYTSATFNNKNVGTGKPVSVSGISISGNRCRQLLSAKHYCQHHGGHYQTQPARYRGRPEQGL